MDDNVNHPAHYAESKHEPIDVIEDWGLGFHLGNVVKYVARAGKKDPTKVLEDLKKARWYLDRHIKNLEVDEKVNCIVGPANEIGPRCPKCSLVMIIHEGEYKCPMCNAEGRKQ
jgi:hypothetical protein